MGLRLRVLTAGTLGCLAAVVAGCGGGSGNLLSSAQKAALTGHLDAISADVSAGRCRKARAEADAFNSAVKNLPSSVSSTLVSNLGQGASTIQTLTANCGAANVSSTTSTTATVTETSSTATVTETSSAPATTTGEATTSPDTSTAAPPADTATSPATATTPAATGTSGGAGVGQVGDGQ